MKSYNFITSAKFGFPNKPKFAVLTFHEYTIDFIWDYQHYFNTDLKPFGPVETLPSIKHDCDVH
jgi:hypothetical protein